MGNKKDLTGMVFERLTVKKENGRSNHGKVIWTCVCECGNEKDIIGGDLLSGRTLSCGCLHKQRASESSIIHGKRHDYLYSTWNGMMDRCYNKKSPNYKYYGGRGISTCDSWRELNNFLADVGDRPEGASLDRIDNSKGYSPENCRWADSKTQSRNRRDNVRITHDGVTKTKIEWAEEKGMHISTLAYRLMIGWSVEDALNKPTRAHVRHK